MKIIKNIEEIEVGNFSYFKMETHITIGIINEVTESYIEEFYYGTYNIKEDYFIFKNCFKWDIRTIRDDLNGKLNFIYGTNIPINKLKFYFKLFLGIPKWN